MALAFPIEMTRTHCNGFADILNAERFSFSRGVSARGRWRRPLSYSNPGARP